MVGFFFGKLDDPYERRNRLQKIVGDYNPTINGSQSDYWMKHFCWPVAIVDGEKRIPADFIKRHNLSTPVLGVVCPSHRPNFSSGIAPAMCGKRKAGGSPVKNPAATPGQ